MPASRSPGCRRARLRLHHAGLFGCSASIPRAGRAESPRIGCFLITSFSTAELDPLPVGAADRRDFATILATTERQVVLSRARRDTDGRLLGRSTLLQGQPTETYLRRNGVPDHAFSETDRLMARPQEFRGLPQALSASACWRDWLREEITAHDGLVRADHPVMQAILGRTQSASSLRQLLRNPLGFVWQYGLRWRAPESGDEPLVLDALAIGDLVHLTLDRALRTLRVGAVGSPPLRLNRSQRRSTSPPLMSLVIWETERAVPPTRHLATHAGRCAGTESPRTRVWR